MPTQRSPLVSIIVLNRNGIDHLRNLFPAIMANAPAEIYELIVVDNASSDQSLEYIKANKENLPLHVIEKSENLSFSAANNQAAIMAKGEFLLLLNNDVVPREGWLTSLLHVIQSNQYIASVGAKLVYPNSKIEKNGGTVQHAGVAFRDEGDFIRPYNLGNAQAVDHPKINESQVRPALTAACLLVEKNKYFEVGGLDENYEYGFEDVDFGLKLLRAGYENYYCAESVLTHDEFGTQSKDRRSEVVERRKRNLQCFRNKWFHYLKSKCWTEKINANPSFYTEASLSILLVGNVAGNATENQENVINQPSSVNSLLGIFKSFGWQVTDQTGLLNRSINVGENIDLVLSLSPNCNVRKISNKRKKLYKMLWLEDTSAIKKKQGLRSVCTDYDMVFDTTGKVLAYDNPRLYSLYYLRSAFIATRTTKNSADLISKWAHEVQKFLLQTLAGTSIAIKLPMRKWEQCHHWGDYYLALHLKEALENEGHSVLLQIVPEWKNERASECSAVIVLRGVSAYVPFGYQVNVMWNISHPEAIPKKEYESYDKVFVASKAYTKQLVLEVAVPVETMLQCVNPSLFYEPDQKIKEKYQHQLLFIGNSRKTFSKKPKLIEVVSEALFKSLLVTKSRKKRNLPYNEISRKIIRDLLPTLHSLAVYGLRWDKFIAKQYIKGSYVANNELYKYYGSATILLNDHWEDMRSHGFISNRIFDGLACGAFIISDQIEEMGEFQQYIVTYSSVDELQQQIDYYLNHPAERKKIAQEGKRYVLENHTFEHRAKQFSDSFKALIKRKNRVASQ